jgi:hypothetical protein
MGIIQWYLSVELALRNVAVSLEFLDVDLGFALALGASKTVCAPTAALPNSRMKRIRANTTPKRERFVQVRLRLEAIKG